MNNPHAPKSRRRFITSTILTGCTATTALKAAETRPSSQTFTLHPIGKVEKTDAHVQIRIFDDYADGLLGLDAWSHVNVFYWFDQNDTPVRRRILQVHPRGNPDNPLTGVFACRAPVRPNLIALSVSKIISVTQNVITLDNLDAFDGTPVLDLKPLIPPDAPTKDIRIPPWAGPRQSPEG